MAFRSLTRGLFQLVSHRRLYSTIEQQKLFNRKSLFVSQPFRALSSAQANEDAYRDLNRFLEKEVQLEKSAQRHPAQLPKVQGFESQTNGPEVTLTRQSGKDKVTVQFNITNTVNATDSNQPGDSDEAGQQQQQPPPQIVGEGSQASAQLKSRPTFTIEINRGGQTLAFLCSFLSDDYPDTTIQRQGEESQNEEGQQLEDFQIDEFTIHDGEWKENIYSADCAVIDGELYDKLLNLLEEHGIGEDFANQLIDFSTAYEHRQYIGLLEKLQKFTKK